MICVIRSAAPMMAFAYVFASSGVVCPSAIISARAETTLSGVPSSWATPEASVPTVFRRSAWRSWAIVV